MFFCKRARTDIDQEICFLSSRAKDKNEGYWKKLLRDTIFLKGTINDVLKLEANDTNTLTWYIDIELSVRADMQSHTGEVFMMVKGAIIISFTKKNSTRKYPQNQSWLVWMTKYPRCYVWSISCNGRDSQWN